MLTPAKVASSILYVSLAFAVLLLVSLLLLPIALTAAFPNLTDPRQIQTIVIWSLVLIWAIWVGILLMVRLARSSWVRRVLGLDEGIPGALDHAVSALQQRFAAAEQALMMHTPPAQGRPRPWVMVIGDQGAGKSAAILRSRLSLQVLDAQGSNFDESHDRDCTWALCGDSVLMDVSGALTRNPARRELWRALLQLLTRRRDGFGADSVVIVVNLRALCQDGPDANRQLAQNLRRQLDDMVEVWGFTPPAHLLFTHLDGVEGFDELTTLSPELTAQLAQQACGRVFAREAHALPSLRDEFINNFNLLVQSIEPIRHLAGANCKGEALRRLLLFPGQLMGCREPMANLIEELSALGRAPSRVPIVGFWLGSSRSAGARFSTISHALHEGLLLRPPSFGVEAPKDDLARTFFLRPLFAGVFPAVSDERLLAWQERRRRERVRWGMSALAMASVALGGLLVASWGLSNLRLLSQVESQSEQLRAALQSPEQILREEGLTALVVTRDLVLSDWTPEAPGALDLVLDWAYHARGLERPSWFTRRTQWVARSGLRTDVETLILAFAQTRMIDPTQSFLSSELERLARDIPPELGTRAPGEPLSAELRDWATRAWFATELSSRWRDLQVQDPEQVDNEALHDQQQRVAVGVGRALARLHDLSQTTLEKPTLSQDAERLIALYWLEHAPQVRRHPALPSTELVGRLNRELLKVKASDLLFAVSLEMTAAPEPLSLRSGAIHGGRGGSLSQGPHGYTAQGCVSFEAQVAHHEQQGTFADFGASDVQEDRVQAARVAYQYGYLAQWSDWLESIRPSVDRLGGAPTRLSVAIEDAYRVGGDMDRLILAAGQGEPLSTPPVEGSGGPPQQQAPGSEWCSCQGQTLWLARSMEPAGARAGDWQKLQSAMGALAQELKALDSDGDARVRLTQDTLDNKGVIADAVMAMDALSTAIRNTEPPRRSCGAAVPAQDLQRLNDLLGSRIEQITLALVNSVWRWLLTEYERDAERAWQADVQPSWLQAKARYPLKVGSTEDATQEDLAALFGEGGTLDTYIQTWLAPLFSGGRPLNPSWPGAPMLALHPNAQQMMQQRAAAVRVVEDLGREWEIRLSCMGLLPSAGPPVTGRRLTVDGVELLACEQQRNRGAVQVKSDSKIVFFATKGQHRDQECLNISASGDWALFRQLDHLSTGRILTVRGSACSVQWGYEEQSPGPARTLYTLRHLALPERLFEPIGAP